MPVKRTTAKGAAKKAKSALKKVKPAAKKAKPADSGGPAHDAFIAAGNKLAGAEESQMFGKPCFKIHGKAFACFFNGDMVFKLGGKTHESAMKLKGAKLFDPSGSGRAMKEWVQVRVSDKSKWDGLAKEAMSYVKTTTK